MSSNSSDLDESGDWSKGEVISIILVCVIFIGLSFYSILKRNNPRNDTQVLLDEPIVIVNNDPSSEFRSRGLDLCVIHSLPKSKYKKSDHEGVEDEDQKTQKKQNYNAECAICLGEFEEGEWLKHLPNCAHVFHVSCIDSWFQSHSNCPLCRSQVVHHYIMNLTTDNEDDDDDLECSVSSSHAMIENYREGFSQQRDVQSSATT